MAELKEQLCEAEESVVMHAGPTSGHDPKHTVEDRATDLHLPNLLDTDFQNKCETLSNTFRLHVSVLQCMVCVMAYGIVVSSDVTCGSTVMPACWTVLSGAQPCCC